MALVAPFAPGDSYADAVDRCRELADGLLGLNSTNDVTTWGDYHSLINPSLIAIGQTAIADGMTGAEWIARMNALNDSIQPDEAIARKYGGSLYDFTSPANLFSERTGVAASTPVIADGPIGTVKDLIGGRHLVASADDRRASFQDNAAKGDGTNDNFTYIKGMGQPVTAANIIVIPDLPDSSPGKGFTCTGLCLSHDGSFWQGNHGIATSAITTFRPSLVNTTKDGILIQDLDLSVLYPTAKSIQGVVEDDENTDHLWFCSNGEGIVRCVSKSGEDIASFAVAGCNAIAIDPVTHLLFVSTTGTVGRYTKAGVLQGVTYAPPFTIDQMHYDAASEMLYCTSDRTVTIAFNDYVGVIHVPTWSLQRYIDIVGPKAIEGVVLDGTDLYISSDEFFHGTAADTNRMYRFVIDPPVIELHKKVTIVSVMRRPTTANTKCIATMGDCWNGRGFGIWSASNADTQMRHIINSSYGAAQRETHNFVAPNLTAYRVIISEFDADTGKTRTFIDGVQAGVDATLANVNSGIVMTHLSALCIGFGGGGYNNNAYMRKLGFIPAILTPEERAAIFEQWA